MASIAATGCAVAPGRSCLTAGGHLASRRSGVGLLACVVLGGPVTSCGLPVGCRALRLSYRPRRHWWRRWPSVHLVEERQIRMQAMEHFLEQRRAQPATGIANRRLRMPGTVPAREPHERTLPGETERYKSSPYCRYPCIRGPPGTGVSAIVFEHVKAHVAAASSRRRPSSLFWLPNGRRAASATRYAETF